jgi:hypothetical protein
MRTATNSRNSTTHTYDDLISLYLICRVSKLASRELLYTMSKEPEREESSEEEQEEQE